MRLCKVCKEPMYTSNFSIWIDGVNYDCHKDCIETYKMFEKHWKLNKAGIKA